MHEFKHGELKSGPSGKGGKVRSREPRLVYVTREEADKDMAVVCK